MQQLDFFNIEASPPAFSKKTKPSKQVDPSHNKPILKKYRPCFFPKEVSVPAANQHFDFLFLIQKQNSIGIEIKDNLVTFTGMVKHRPTLKRAVRKFFIMTAYRHLAPRVLELSEQTRLMFRDLRFKHQKSRWGSCSELKNINLNIRLLFLPSNLIDCVIIHELCHLKHLNHSKAFWNLVSTFDSNYKIHETQLNSADKYVPKWVFGI